MSYLADIYRNFDPLFAEENASMVSFPNCTEVGSIVFIGSQGAGKHSILGQLIERFKPIPGSSYVEEDVNAELRNVIFKIPIISCPTNFSELQNVQTIFENCQIIILIIDCTKELPIDLISSVNSTREQLDPKPAIHVFLNKTDLLDSYTSRNILSSHSQKILDIISDAIFHSTSINDGTALLEISLCIESILPKKDELRATMEQFQKSLELSNVFLIDLQSSAFMISSGESAIKPNQFLMCKDGVEMFVNLTNVMDSKSAQPISSVELKYGTFIHFFWSAYDVILVGISDKRIPSATSKNNVIALLNSIRNILSE